MVEVWGLMVGLQMRESFKQRLAALTRDAFLCCLSEVIPERPTQVPSISRSKTDIPRDPPGLYDLGGPGGCTQYFGVSWVCIWVSYGSFIGS